MSFLCKWWPQTQPLPMESMCTQETTKSSCGIRCKQEESVGLCPNVTQQVLFVCFDWPLSATYGWQMLMWWQMLIVFFNIKCFQSSLFALQNQLGPRQRNVEVAKTQDTVFAVNTTCWHQPVFRSVVWVQWRNNPMCGFASGHNSLTNQFKGRGVEAVDSRQWIQGREVDSRPWRPWIQGRDAITDKWPKVAGKWPEATGKWPTSDRQVTEHWRWVCRDFNK